MHQISKIGSIGIVLLLSSLALMALPEKRVTKLVVVEDGRQLAAPTEIKAKFDNQILHLQVRAGTFESPAELVSASKVVVEMNVMRNHIRLTGVTASDFAGGKWTLRLAQHANDDYFEWRGSKSADIASSCILELDSGHEDPARELFLEHCRTKVR